MFRKPRALLLALLLPFVAVGTVVYYVADEQVSGEDDEPGRPYGSDGSASQDGNDNTTPAVSTPAEG